MSARTIKRLFVIAALASLGAGCKTYSSVIVETVDVEGDVTDDAGAFTHVDVRGATASMYLDHSGIDCLITVPREGLKPVLLSLTGPLPTGESLDHDVELRICACHPRPESSDSDGWCDEGEERTCTDLRATMTGTYDRLDCDSDGTDCLENLDATLTFPPNAEFFGTVRLVQVEEWQTEWYDGPLL